MFLSTGNSRWFVYLFALADCSAFKVGFSCSPLQRIYTFSRRYFEQFDIFQSVLLEMQDCDDARELERNLKAELAEFRHDVPSWVPPEAGGYSEWFSAVYFARAEGRLRSFTPKAGVPHAIGAFDFIRDQLTGSATYFESWAWSQAQFLCACATSTAGARGRTDAALSLRNWLDAYRYFGVPLFQDDAAVLRFVTEVSRSAAR
jgi:T5orf172 domain